jgi:hypothetical protein
MLFKVIIPIYTENYIKCINKDTELLTVEPSGTYIYH